MCSEGKPRSQAKKPRKRPTCIFHSVIRRTLLFSSLLSYSWVLYIIRFGYRIPFISWPPRAFFCNNRSALDHASFVDSAISDLLLAGSVIEVFTPPTVVNPLTVSVNSVGKRRLILDLCHVNKFIPKVKFKMEDSRTFLNYVHSPGYMFKFHMKFGYHHVSIH